MSADDALGRLKEGNQRFRGGQARECALNREEMVKLSKGQQPFATILGCSDSRVAPEWIFDAALGELFVIRVAGNVLSPEVAGSLQYAGCHLRTPLFVVLGHEGCGAVHAALATRDEGVIQRSRIQILVDSILPALPQFDAQVSADARLSQSVEAGVRYTVQQIQQSPEGKVRMAEGVIRIIGAVYDLETGVVRWLEPVGKT